MVAPDVPLMVPLVPGQAVPLHDAEEVICTTTSFGKFPKSRLLAKWLLLGCPACVVMPPQAVLNPLLMTMLLSNVLFPTGKPEAPHMPCPESLSRIPHQPLWNTVLFEITSLHTLG